MKIKKLLCVVTLLLLVGCSSKYVAIGEDREVNLGQKESNSLYEYSKEEIDTQKFSSGFYPLTDHLDSFAARVMLANAATKSIKLQYFSYHEGITGSILMNAIGDAANRGVKVEMLLDDMSLNSKDEILASINQHENITIRSFNPTNNRGALHIVEMGIYPSSLGRRMHNKAFIVDNSMAVFGGRNIGDQYFGLSEDLYFLDDDILAMGKIVNDLTNQFEYYFSSKFSVSYENIADGDKSEMVKGKEDLEEYLKSKEANYYEELFLEREFVQLFIKKEVPFYFANADLYFDKPKKIETESDDKTYHLEGTIDQKYSPKKSFIITNPYFIPNVKIMDELRKLREKGVEIAVATNSLEATDGKFVYAYYKDYQEELLRMGVKLYEIIPSALNDELKGQKYMSEVESITTLHAKTMIIDGRYFVIGSSNLDPRSRNLNTELVAIIDSPELCEYEKEVFDFITQPNNAYELSLECEGNDSLDCEIVWSANIDGEDKKFDNDGDASMMDKIIVFFSKLFPIEELL